MLTLNYFLMKMPKSEGKYMPNTKPASKYKLKDFLVYICKKNRNIPANTYKEVFKTMTEAVEEIISQGSSITIPGFMRITPVIKGVFDSYNEPFNASKHSIGVNCTILSSFAESVRRKISVKRIKTPDRFPYIIGISDFKTKSSVIQKNYANRISGAFFNLKRFEFAGLTISSNAMPDKSIMMEKSDMEIINHTNLEIVYNFNRSFVPPDWLVNGAGISIKLMYKKKDGSVISTTTFSSEWVS